MGARSEELRARLAAELDAAGSLAVAFSGGVDSTVLLHAAHARLGPRAVGLIADSPSLPRAELADARRAAAAIGARLEVLATTELDDEGYRANAGDRCYFCKAALFRAMEAWARAAGFRRLAFGEIVDDALDHRPGARAAAEFAVCAPLTAAGFTKDDVRAYARAEGLEAAEKPASACLASRIPVGTRVAPELLQQVERAEALLRALGISELRVRHHGAHAKVEVAAPELEHARAHWADCEAALREAGFATSELARYVPPAERARGA